MGSDLGKDGCVSEDLRVISQRISELPDDWHGSGTVSQRVIEALVRHLGRGVTSSVETGTGRTTLLFSHLSDDHAVFTVDDAGDGDSLRAVQNSPILRADHVQFIVGRTQQTLRQFEPKSSLQFAYLDGPHGYPFPELEYWAVYPHIEAGGFLIIDDVHIRTVHNMFEFLRNDAMWRLVEVVGNTAFFRRTAAPTVDPYGDGWWLQGYNRTFTFAHLEPGRRLVAWAKERTPEGARRALRKLG